MFFIIKIGNQKIAKTSPEYFPETSTNLSLVITDFQGNEFKNTNEAPFLLLKNWTFSWDPECLKTILMTIPVDAPVNFLQAPFFINVPLMPEEIKHILAVEVGMGILWLYSK